MRQCARQHLRGIVLTHDDDVRILTSSATDLPGRTGSQQRTQAVGEDPVYTAWPGPLVHASSATGRVPGAVAASARSTDKPGSSELTAGRALHGLESYPGECLDERIELRRSPRRAVGRDGQPVQVLIDNHVSEAGVVRELG